MKQVSKLVNVFLEKDVSGLNGIQLFSIAVIWQKYFIYKAITFLN